VEECGSGWGRGRVEGSDKGDLLLFPVPEFTKTKAIGPLSRPTKSPLSLGGFRRGRLCGAVEPKGMGYFEDSAVARTHARPMAARL
jgi:hypothetical protein